VRMALKATPIDPASFTTNGHRFGALTLGLIVRVRDHSARGEGNWVSAFAIFATRPRLVRLPITHRATGALISLRIGPGGR